MSGSALTRLAWALSLGCLTGCQWATLPISRAAGASTQGVPPPVSVAAPTRAGVDASAPTLFPSLTPPPLQNRTPEPTLTPAPTLRQLTSGGCCVQPFWSPDGAQVWFIDRPDDVQPGGIWGVDAAGGGEPQFISDRVGQFSPDGALIAYPESGQTIVERLATGEKWPVPADGRAILFSPDSTQIAWQTASSTVNFDRRLVEVRTSAVNGDHARMITRLIGGSLIGWFPDSARLLVSGRESVEAEPFLAIVNSVDGTLTRILQAGNVRGASISPEGGWVAYQVTFSGDVARDGFWAVRTDGSAVVKLPVFGAYRWRAEGRLLVVPLETNASSHRLVEVEAASGSTADLTDPRVTPFRIAGGDWSLSPDGDRIAFVNNSDRNIWVIELRP